MSVTAGLIVLAGGIAAAVAAWRLASMLLADLERRHAELRRAFKHYLLAAGESDEAYLDLVDDPRSRTLIDGLRGELEREEAMLERHA